MNKKRLRSFELRLIAELMKNCRRSDRELARAVGASQNRTSRAIRKLEKEGYVKEYAAIPDFRKLGFEILSFDLYKLMENVSQSEIEERRGLIREELKKEPMAHILGMSGMGCDADRIIVTYHENYASYTNFLKRIRRNPLKAGNINSFVVDLACENHFQGLSLSELAKYMMAKASNLE